MDLFSFCKGILISLSTQELHKVLYHLLHVCWQRQEQRLLQGVKLLPRVTAFKSSLRKSKVPAFYQKTNTISTHDGKYWKRLIFPYIGILSPSLCCQPLMMGIHGCGRISSGEVA